MKNLLVALFCALALPAFAQEDVSKVYEEIANAIIYGPDQVSLSNQAVLDIPEDMLFIPQPQADKYSYIAGNAKDPNLIGIVLPNIEDSYWAAFLSYEASGYISDKDALNWNAKDLLNSYKKGNEAANKERKSRGIPEMHVVGWMQEPLYDYKANKLSWGIRFKEVIDGEDSLLVNYNTLALGREGYIEIVFVTDPEILEQEKVYADRVLAAVNYKPEKAYSAYNSATDKTSSAGLSALIVGGGAAVVAKKVGLVAIIAKFGKLIILGAIAAVVAVFKRISGKKDKGE